MAKRVSVDGWLFTVTLILVFVGLVMVFSASAVMAKERYGSPYSFVLKQFGSAVVGVYGPDTLDAKLANNAVTSNKINTEAVTTGKIYMKSDGSPWRAQINGRRPANVPMTAAASRAGSTPLNPAVTPDASKAFEEKKKAMIEGKLAPFDGVITKRNVDVGDLIDQSNEDLYLFSTDYPHGDCDFPHSVTKFRRRTDLSDEAKEMILWKNPARLYGIS